MCHIIARGARVYELLTDLGKFLKSGLNAYKVHAGTMNEYLIVRLWL